MNPNDPASPSTNPSPAVPAATPAAPPTTTTPPTETQVTVPVPSVTPTPPPVMPIVAAPSPAFQASATGGYVATLQGEETRSRLKLALIWLAAIVVVLIIYFLILPAIFSSQYESAVAAPYKAQANAMAAVYTSFSKPVFTSNNTTAQSDYRDLADTQASIAVAQNETKSLKSADNYVDLPGTGLFGPGAGSHKHFVAMKQYVSDSQALLTNYKSLVTYINSLEQITQAQLPVVQASLQAIQNAHTSATLQSTVSFASTRYTSLISALDTLQPPADLQSVQSSLLSGLNSINNGLKAILTGLATNNPQQVASGGQEIITGSVALSAAGATDVAGQLQHNSIIHTSMVKLQAEHPLQS